MFFTSWRNENTDLIGNNCSSYQEHYLLSKNKLHEQMKQYALCSQDDLNEIHEQLNSMEDAQNLEPQNEEEGAQDSLLTKALYQAALK